MPMDDKEKAAILVSLLETLAGRGGARAQGPTRAWATSLHPHLDSWAWHPQSGAGYRLSGRLRLHQARRVGRY